MTNEEKLEYLRRIHKLFMKYKIDKCSEEEQKKLLENFKYEFAKSILPYQPSKLYRYRKVNKDNLDSIKNDYAWFSILDDFDHSTDGTLNIDPEKEIKIMEADNGKMMAEYNLEFAKLLLKGLGITAPDEQFRECLSCFDKDGNVNSELFDNFINVMMPDVELCKKEELKNKILQINACNLPKEITNPTEEYLNTFINLNKNLQEGTMNYCLSEESDNPLLWGTYAESSTGFCIEYSIPFCTDSLSSEYRMNMFPIYYGEKAEIKLFDMLKKSVFFSDKNYINGIAPDDYEKMFISSYTKDESWIKQKEWRITLAKESGNKHHMPFISSIILGERMDEKIKLEIIDICREKTIPLYQRKYNFSRSKIIVEKIDY